MHLYSISEFDAPQLHRLFHLCRESCAMSSCTVESGHLSSGVTASCGDTVTIHCGGTTSCTTVTSGGTEYVSSGGSATSSTIASGGLEVVYGGGLVSNTIVSGTALTSTGSATQLVYGGTAIGTILDPGASQIVISGGLVSKTDILSGSIQNVYAGGTAFDNIVAGGRENVSSGGVDISGTIQGGNIVWIYSGGTGVGEIVSGNATSAAEIWNDGITSGVSLYTNASEVVACDGVASSTKVYSGGSLIVSGGLTTGTVISNGGSEIVSSGGTDSGSVVSSGGVETVMSGGTATTVTIAGGTLDLQTGSTASGTISFASGTAGTLEIDGTTMPTATISGFVSGDVIDLTSVAYKAGDTVSISGTTLTLKNASGTTLETLKVSSGLSASSIKIIEDAGCGTELCVCFLRGSHIATPDGERLVEQLAQGDMVSVMVGTQIVSQPVRWIGHRAIDVSELADPARFHPVRIRQNAFADGVPHRDLLVTQEHCILVDGRLIPARMLVNRRSIILDRSFTSYEFFHVELDRHGILLSEGLTTESYLDTGNRAVFGLDQPVRTDGMETAAPLAVDRETVEPIWNRLVARAEMCFAPLHAETMPRLNDDPDLRLLLDDGRELAARWHEGMRHMFHIPKDAKPVRILSRTAVPAEIIGPFCDDRRQLGVAVEGIVLWNGLDDTALDLQEIGLPGWHGPEGDRRWTDGAAVLDLPAAERADTFVDIRLAATLSYAA
ncbi:MAG: Hint domain-containing protein [Janthinobacterium lividum]